jgi:hypothetical protein
MVRTGLFGVVCVMSVMVSGTLGCKPDAEKSAARLTPPAMIRSQSTAPDGEFRYLDIDGVRMIGWFAPDGKQVMLMRVDTLWVCDQSSGQLRCGPKQAATTACPTCQINACPCADARCLPMCVSNPSTVPGLHEPATTPSSTGTP